MDVMTLFLLVIKHFENTSETCQRRLFPSTTTHQRRYFKMASPTLYFTPPQGGPKDHSQALSALSLSRLDLHMLNKIITYSLDHLYNRLNIKLFQNRDLWSSLTNSGLLSRPHLCDLSTSTVTPLSISFIGSASSSSLFLQSEHH